MLKSRHAQQEETLRAFLDKRQVLGEIPASKNTDELAQFLNCVLHGMSITAREGASDDALMQITATTLRLWPEMLKN